MRTIIAGSRGLGDAHVRAAMEACGWLPTAVISGKARGADEAGEKWAHERSIPVELFPAKWRALGKPDLGRSVRICPANCALTR